MAVANRFGLSACAVCVAKISTSSKPVSPVDGVANKLLGSIGVFVTAGGVEYGVLHPTINAERIVIVEAINAPRFIRAIVSP